MRCWREVTQKCVMREPLLGDWKGIGFPSTCLLCLAILEMTNVFVVVVLHTFDTYRNFSVCLCFFVIRKKFLSMITLSLKIFLASSLTKYKPVQRKRGNGSTRKFFPLIRERHLFWIDWKTSLRLNKRVPINKYLHVKMYIWFHITSTQKIYNNLLINRQLMSGLS